MKKIKVFALLLLSVFVATSCFAAIAVFDVVTAPKVLRANVSQKQFYIADKNQQERLFYWKKESSFLINNQNVSAQDFFKTLTAPKGSQFSFSFRKENAKDIVFEARIEKNS